METSKPKRRWLRFSLRSMLLLVLGLSVFFAVYANRVHRQQRAIAAIETLGGSVSYANGEAGWTPDWLRKLLGKDFFFDVKKVHLDSGAAIHNVKDEDLRHLLVFPHLKDVYLQSNLITDEGLDTLRQLEELEAVYLISAQVSDEGLAKLKGLQNLRALNLDWTGVTSSGLRHLSSFPNLEHLHLMELHLNEDGLSHLQSMTKLRYLYLGFSEVGDADLKHLSKMNNLSTLILRET